MLFGSLFRRKKKEISKELFGERILSQMLLTTAMQSPDLFEELGVEMTFTHYLFYLEHLLFLSKKILLQRYSLADTKIIIYSTLNGMVDFMDMVATDKKNEVKSLFKKMYDEFDRYSEDLCSDIGSEMGLRNLASSFLEGCDIGKDMLGHILIFTHLSGFVIHHMSDILNDEIVLL